MGRRMMECEGKREEKPAKAELQQLNGGGVGGDVRAQSLLTKHTAATASVWSEFLQTHVCSSAPTECSPSVLLLLDKRFSVAVQWE